MYRYSTKLSACIKHIRIMARLAFLALLPLIAAQQIGTIPEVHPQLTTYHCTRRNGCVQQNTSIVLDAATHRIHKAGTNTSCTNASGLDRSICPDKATCSQNCVIEGISDYRKYGVQTSGSRITLRQYLRDATTNQTRSVSPRVYLLAEDGESYHTPSLLNQEFAFDVDVSTLVCGMNGALYFSDMLPSGGRSALNPAGATYGTGYCDAQCYSTPWINGEANIAGHGSCCNEMDIWEANARATGYTPHTCNTTGLYECRGAECGDQGVCDKPGCGFNPYALGARSFYGHDLTVDTTRPFTVVTQFLTKANTSTSALSEIRRLYIQSGGVIQNARVHVDEQGKEIDSLTDSFCTDSAASFTRLGGMKQMGEALGRGMTLAFSIWNDPGSFMQWLDGGDAGPCNAAEGDPKLIEKLYPETRVTFANVRWGDIGATFGGRTGLGH